MTRILLNPIFLVVLGTVLALLRLTNLIHLSWLVIFLVFFIRPIVIGLANLGIYLIREYERKKWTPKVGDTAYFRNMADGWTKVTINSINKETGAAQVISKGTYSTSNQTINLSFLYPTNY